jgi:nucleoside-diphosphate-sugar epimerase
MMEANNISRVAMTGVTGNVGRHITDALLKTGKHTITAITRSDRYVYAIYTWQTADAR